MDAVVTDAASASAKFIFPSSSSTTFFTGDGSEVYSAATVSARVTSTPIVTALSFFIPFWSDILLPDA